MKSKINMQLENSQELRVEVTEYFSDVFQNKIDDPTKKEIILVAHYNLFIEHYDSIISLIKLNNIGSAIALLRTLLDTEYRGLWLISVANEDEIKQYLEDKLHFHSKDIFKKLDEAYDTDKYFQTEKKNAWKVLSDYTHTGIYQIRKRLRENKIGSFYTDDDIVAIFEVIEKNLLLFTYLVLNELGKNKESDYLRMKMKNREPLK